MRGILRHLIQQFYSSPRISIPLVIIGFNPTSHLLCDSIREELTQYEFVGFLDADALGCEYSGYPVLGRPEQLPDLVRVHPCLEAAVAIPDAPLADQARMVELCEKSRLRWWVVPWVYRSAPTGLRVDTVGLIPMVGRRGIECRRPELPGQAHLRHRLRISHFDCRDADNRSRRPCDFNFRRQARFSSASSESAHRAADLKC